MLRSLKLSLRIIQLPNPLRHTATLVDTITVCLFNLECTIALFQTEICMHRVYYRTLPPSSPHRTRSCFFLYMCVYCLAFLAFSSPPIRIMNAYVFICVLWAIPGMMVPEIMATTHQGLCICMCFFEVYEKSNITG